MGWSIGLLENEIKISKALAKKIYKATTDDGYNEHFHDVDDVAYDGYLNFNPDHMEHMDFMWNEDIQKVLKEAKVEGKVTFGSLEGDNDGSFWGYEFDGKGGMKRLVGKVVWEEDTEEPEIASDDEDEEYDEDME